MGNRIKRLFKRLSLAQQFLAVNLVVLILGMIAIGWWVGWQIKMGVIDYSAVTTALYVDSFVAPVVQELAESDTLPVERIETLERLLNETPLGQEVVAFKIWNHQGRIVYATNPRYVDLVFPIEDGLAEAWQGNVSSEISDLEDAENFVERTYASQLLETYSPVRQRGANRVIAVAEFYQPIDSLQVEILEAQVRSWLFVGAAMLVMYLLLAGIVKPASDVIVRQEADLREKVARLTGLLAQNKKLSERVRGAATRTTALNERFLRRISAELHDGPGQDLGLALLRIEALADSYGRYLNSIAENNDTHNDFQTVQIALISALTDLRAISSGLRLPKIETLSLAETIHRAVRDYERKTQVRVTLTLDEPLPADASIPFKMTLYRLLQESLSNGYRHAQGKGQTVSAGVKLNELVIEVADEGPGFDPQAVPSNGHFGLMGMQERVEILGGHFEIESVKGMGTTIRAYLPLVIPEMSSL